MLLLTWPRRMRGKVLEEGNAVEKVWLRIEEVAHALGLGRSTVYAMVKSGEMAAVHVGRSLRVPVEALRAWAERKSRSAPAEADAGGDAGAGGDAND